MTHETVTTAPTTHYIDYNALIEKLVQDWSPEYQQHLVQQGGYDLYKWLREMKSIHVSGHRQSGKTRAIACGVDPTQDIVITYNRPVRMELLSRFEKERDIDFSNRCFTFAHMATVKSAFFTEEQIEVLGPVRRIWVDDFSWCEAHLEVKELYHLLTPLCNFNTSIVALG